MVEKLNAVQLQGKIDNEGGALLALEYGLTVDMIEDPVLAELWEIVVALYSTLEYPISQFEDALEIKADAESDGTSL